ncbi:MAG: photosystem II biogenesis protein Psp29 [Elainellaceae cyanobacterium]
MNNVRTVSDTKRAFYNAHTRPINSLYRRVVEELMVEMHLLSVNVNFQYNAIYALGVVTSFDRFMLGYRPEQDLASIFSALCQAVESDPHKYRQDAQQVLGDAAQLSVDDLMAFGHSETSQALSNTALLGDSLQGVANNPQFKYSRLWAIGLYTIVETIEAAAVEDPARLKEILEPLCERMHFSFDKLQKDLDIYRSNLEKLEQARIVMEDILKADRKKREQRQSTEGQSTEGQPESKSEEGQSAESQSHSGEQAATAPSESQDAEA